MVLQTNLHNYRGPHPVGTKNILHSSWPRNVPERTQPLVLWGDLLQFFREEWTGKPPCCRDRQPWMTLGALGRKANRDWRSRAAGWEKTCLGVRMLNIPCLSISSRLRIRKFVRPVMAMLIPTNSSGWRLTPWSLTIFHHGFIVIESSSQPGFSAMDFNHEMGISSFWGKKSEVSWL